MERTAAEVLALDVAALDLAVRTAAVEIGEAAQRGEDVTGLFRRATAVARVRDAHFAGTFDAAALRPVLHDAGFARGGGR